LKGSDRGAAALATGASLGGLFSAAACCVLPLALAAVGLGAGGLSAFIPFHWPLTVAATMATAVGWFLYLRKRRACARDEGCTSSAPTKATLVMLCTATLFVALSVIWPFYIEAPLMKLFGGP
jgi:mercuric ion transport protein